MIEGVAISNASNSGPWVRTASTVLWINRRVFKSLGHVTETMYLLWLTEDAAFEWPKEDGGAKPPRPKPPRLLPENTGRALNGAVLCNVVVGVMVEPIAVDGR